MRAPRLLDLFSGAGGAGYGYHLAGFEVTGVDIRFQHRYPFDFVNADALAYLDEFGHEFDAIHASPPCQAHSAMRTMHNALPHRDLIPETRRLLQETGRPYVIENVVGAELHDPVLLCGSMFGLGCAGGQLLRHRLFETSFAVPQMACRHEPGLPVIGVYGGHVRDRRRRHDSQHRGRETFGIADAEAAMEIDWMTLAELSQAIPPAYTRHLGGLLRMAVAHDGATA